MELVEEFEKGKRRGSDDGDLFKAKRGGVDLCVCNGKYQSALLSLQKWVLPS